MSEIRSTQASVRFGAAVTLTRLEDLCDSLASSKPASQLRVFTQIKEMLRWFAGKQIRNVAAVGGNIMTGSPISDLNPIFLAAGCTLEIRSYTGPTKRVAFNEKFYTGYRRNILQPDEVLVSLTIPFTSPSQHFVAYKQSKRRDDDIAIVNSAFWLDLQAGAVKQIRIAFGGVAPVTKLALETCSVLKGEQWSRDLVDKAAGALLLEFPLPPDVPGAMVRYRQSLILSFFLKFFLTVDKEACGSVAPAEDSATQVFSKPALQSSQLWELRPEAGAGGPLGTSIPHRAAEKQVAGTAVYTDDIPPVAGELHLGLVLSTRAHATILGVDPAAARRGGLGGPQLGPARRQHLRNRHHTGRACLRGGHRPLPGPGGGRRGGRGPRHRPASRPAGEGGVQGPPHHYHHGAGHRRQVLPPLVQQHHPERRCR